MKNNKVKFECLDCGCYFWVDNRNTFKCPNCEVEDKVQKSLTGRTITEEKKSILEIYKK